MSFLKSLLNLLYPPRCPFCNSLLGGRGGGDRSFEGTAPNKNCNDGDDRDGCDGSNDAGDGDARGERNIGGARDSRRDARENCGGGGNSSDSGRILVAGWEGLLCRRCAAELPWLAGAEYCPRCARPLTREDGVCSYCRGFNPAFDRCVALGCYRGEIRRAVHRFKYGGKKSLARPLGLLLAAKLSKAPWLSSVDLLVPVPLHRERLLKRGYNQAALLTKVVGKKLHLPTKEILKRVRDTQSQTGLSRKQRRENIKGAFRCREELQKGGHILLLDDVLTSGATAKEAALVLKTAGAGRISVAVTALVPPPPQRTGEAPLF